MRRKLSISIAVAGITTAIAPAIADVLAVVNVYIDEDIQAWRSYMPVYPEEWYNGFDPDFVLRNDEIYNVRAIPSLYLLDEEKRVILKDAPENKLFNYLLSYTGKESYR